MQNKKLKGFEKLIEINNKLNRLTKTYMDSNAVSKSLEIANNLSTLTALNRFSEMHEIIERSNKLAELAKYSERYSNFYMIYEKLNSINSRYNYSSCFNKFETIQQKAFYTHNISQIELVNLKASYLNFFEQYAIPEITESLELINNDKDDELLRGAIDDVSNAPYFDFDYFSRKVNDMYRELKEKHPMVADIFITVISGLIINCVVYAGQFTISYIIVKPSTDSKEGVKIEQSSVVKICEDENYKYYHKILYEKENGELGEGFTSKRNLK